MTLSNTVLRALSYTVFVIKTRLHKAINTYRWWLLLATVSILASASSPFFYSNHGTSQVALIAAAEQGHMQARLALASAFANAGKRSEQLLWLTRAAQSGSAEAAFQLSEQIPAQHRYWLEQAALLGNLRAQIAWSYLHLEQPPSINFHSRSLPTLSQEARAQLAEIALAWPSQFPNVHWRTVAPDTEEWRLLKHGANELLGVSGQCDRNIRFYLDDVSTRRYALVWIAELYELFRMVSGRLCFQVDYLPEQSQCQPVGERAFCEPVYTDSETTQVFVTKAGRANTRNGQIFIQANADWRILLHELGHAWGLADEYAMRSDVRASFCRGEFNFKAKNIAFSAQSLISDTAFQRFQARIPWREALTGEIGRTVYIQGLQYWQLGSEYSRDDIGLYAAATCEGLNTQAWKPVSDITFMEVAETGVIPKIYLHWMLQQERSEEKAGHR